MAGNFADKGVEKYYRSPPVRVPLLTTRITRKGRPVNSSALRTCLTAAALAAAALAPAQASVTTIPTSALSPSTQYYTDLIGGGIGAVALDRNDDSYSGPLNLGFSVSFFGQTYNRLYKGMNWEVTNTSTVAAVGFGDGAGNGEVLAGSIQPGLNTAVANHKLWFDANLAPVNQTPEPASLALLGFALTGLAVFRRQRG